jgi:transposase-like protein/IS1 family transposase
MMIRCAHTQTKRFGYDRKRNPRVRCLLCGKTWIERQQPKLLGEMRVPLDKALFALKLLLEGTSIRAACRLTGLDKATVINLVVLIGTRARQFWNDRMRGIHCERIQVDEIWGFVGMKERTRQIKHRSQDFGDAYCFTALDPDSKLLITWHVGKRCEDDTHWFCEKLGRTVTGRCQITTDGWTHYAYAVIEGFNRRADFAQLIKIFSKPQDQRTYSPSTIKGTRRRIVAGDPDPDHISTSMVERSNLTWRMRCRRLTRLTNAHSKIWFNHEAALAMTFAVYNFCTVHSTLKTTPAVAHGLTDHVWTLEELLGELAAHA